MESRGGGAVDIKTVILLKPINFLTYFEQFFKCFLFVLVQFRYEPIGSLPAFSDHLFSVIFNIPPLSHPGKISFNGFQHGCWIFYPGGKDNIQMSGSNPMAINI